MMYMHEPSLRQLKADLARFYQAALTEASGQWRKRGTLKLLQIYFS
jgi:hypothetical protein